MNKKLLILVTFLFLFSIFSNLALAAPQFSDSGIQNNNTQYAPGKNFGFQINITDDVCGMTCIVNATFETNITTGTTTLQNITRTADGVVNPSGYNFQNDTTGIWWINFTQEETKGVNVYVFKWYSYNESGEIAGSSQSIFIIVINSTTYVRLFLNETEGNRAYNATQGANFTVDLNTTEPKTVYLETNFTSGWQDSGTRPLYNYTTTPAVASAVYNITGYFTGDQNYTGSSQTYFATVNDNTPPSPSIITPSPASGEYGSRTVTFNCSATDNVALSAMNISVWFTNGTFYQSWVEERSGTFNFTNVTNTFTKGELRQANNTFLWNCMVNDTSGISVSTAAPRQLIIAVSDLFGYVRNSTGDAVQAVNVSIYRFIQQQSGPPLEIYLKSSLTTADGNFSIVDVNVSGQSSQFKLSFILNNSAGNATEVGPTLPAFPRQIVFKEVPGYPLPPGAPGVNGSTIYLQPAGTIRLSAVNRTGQNVNFGYEIIDQALGFPIKSCVQCNVGSVDVVVPRDRNYTVMIVRDPQTFPFGATCMGPGAMNVTHCPSPPLTNSTIYSSMFTAADEYVVDVTMNLTYSQYRLTGYVNVSGNATPVNFTKIVPRLIPWTGFVPPTKAEIESFNLSRDVNFTKGGEQNQIAFYNISVMGSPSGIEYLVEFYGNGTGEYFASFRNVSVTQDIELNVTMTKLAGTYMIGGDVNTSKITVQLQNSTGHNLTSAAAHIEVMISHSDLYGGQPVHYIIEQLTNGSFSLPILNDSTAKVNIFSQDAAPQRRTLNLSRPSTDIILKPFGMQFRNETTGDFQDFNTTLKTLLELRFYRSTATCNVLKPPSTCQLGTTFNGSFNPLNAMIAGKSNLWMNLTSSNIILYFINVDLLASGPPDAQMSEQAISTISTGSSFEQAWKFGSLAPDIYDYVWIGIPYSGLDETWSYNVKIPALYDEDWNLIWNVTTNGTNPGAIYTEYADYTSDWFTGKSCSKSDSTADCFMNTSTDYFWIKIPHFSGIQPTITGSAPAAEAPAQQQPAGGSISTTEIAVGKLVKTFTYINPLSPKKISATEFEETGLHLTEIEINVKNRVVAVKITIEKLDQKPADVEVEVTGQTYQYIKITKQNLEDENIEKGVIKFKVEKSWVTANDIDPATIALYRFANNKWNKLNTTKFSEDDDYIYYEAITPGFSYFAISGEKLAVTTTTTTTTTVTTTTTTTTTTIPPEKVPTKVPTEIIVLVLIIFLFAVIAVIILFGRGTKKLKKK